MAYNLYTTDIQAWSLEGKLVHTAPLPVDCVGYSMIEVLSNEGDIALTQGDKKEVIIGKINMLKDQKECTFEVVQRLPLENSRRENNQLSNMWLDKGVLKIRDLTETTFEYHKLFD